MIDKTYSPVHIEKKLYQEWVSSNLFDPKEEGKPYAIVFPPPNVTGILHIGHTLNFTLQDIYSRYKRMTGHSVLWVPGIDHAGIATQMMVERNLLKEGKTRQELGRDAFLKHVWEWKERFERRIIDQLEALGISCTWSRLRFTLDEGLSKAVTRTFVDLYKQGYLYRDHRLVNWDIQLQTAISDLEVVYEEREGTLTTIAYPLKESQGQIHVATVRPETLFGDEAVAVHPEDEKYKHLIGKTCILPLVGKEIPIIADEVVKKEFGTGAVKITPAHDFNDFKVGTRHGLKIESVMNLKGCLNDRVPKAYQGMDRFSARKKVIEELEEQGYLVKQESYKHSIPIGDRSGREIEPTLTWQWFVAAEKLAKPVLELVAQGKTNFHPEQWKKVFCRWLENIEPWCVSRQLWWGHRIPAWYHQDAVFVSESEEEAYKQARQELGEDVVLRQDDDVLDTWFSSGLWPFSVLGWPNETPQVKKDISRYYPASLLVTGNDILFFWVARMMMMGHFSLQEESFYDVIINPIVKDAKGQKMSKTKGNTIDPMTSIQKYGADALRFALIVQASPGRDIHLDEARIGGMRTFATKLWNAVRFYQIYDQKRDENENEWLLSESHWILKQWKDHLQEITDFLEKHRSDRAAQTLYKFLWSIFCDWYIELIKPDLVEKNEKSQEHLNCARYIMESFLRALHPFMPILSEYLYRSVCDTQDFLLQKTWPVVNERIDEGGVDAIRRLTEIVTTVRASCTLLLQHQPNVSCDLSDARDDDWLDIYARRLAKLCGIKLCEEGSQIKKQDYHRVEVKKSGLTVILYVEKEAILLVREQIEKQMDKIGTLIKKSEANLNNKKFLDYAPAAVVEEKRASHRQMEALLRDLQQQQSQLGVHG